VVALRLDGLSRLGQGLTLAFELALIPDGSDSSSLEAIPDALEYGLARDGFDFTGAELREPALGLGCPLDISARNWKQSARRTGAGPPAGVAASMWASGSGLTADSPSMAPVVGRWPGASLLRD